MAETETVLLRRFIRSGDAEAFAEIIGRHAGLVYGAALRILADVDRASDVAQETFLQLAKDAGTVTGSLPGWLHRVATHKAIDQVRRDATRKHREAEYVAARPQETAEWKEISPFVDEGLNLLDPHLRAILIAHFLEGRSTRAIARAQGLSQATISRRIEAGIEQLRAGLRRRGVLVAAAALGVLLADHAIQAAPQALLTELGKIALISGSLIAPATTAAEAASGVGTIATSILTTIKTHGVALAAVVALGIGSALIYWQAAKPPQPQAQAPAPPVTPSTVDSTFDPPGAPSFAGGPPQPQMIDRQIVASTGRPGGVGRWTLQGSAPLGLPGPEAETDPRAYIPASVESPGSSVVTVSTPSQAGASDRPEVEHVGLPGAPAAARATESPCETPVTDREISADPNLLPSVSMGPVVAAADLRLLPPVKGSPVGMLKLQHQETTTLKLATMREMPPDAPKRPAYFMFRADGRDLQGAVYRSTCPGGPMMLCLDTDSDGLWSDEKSYLGRRLWSQPVHATYEFGPVCLRQGCDEPGGDAFYAQCSEGKWLSFWPAFYRDGRVVLNGKTHRLALVDSDFDGRFNEWFVPSAEDSRDPAGDVLAVDLDGDGEFVDRRPGEAEILPLGRVIRVGDRYYGLELAENGSRIEFRQAELYGAQDASSSVWHAPGRWVFAEQVAGDCEDEGRIQMNRRVVLTAVVLAASQAAMANPLPPEGCCPAGGFSAGIRLPERVLRFPTDQPLGQIHLVDERYVKPEISREFHPGYVFAPGQYLGPAQSDVVIPAGKCACLHLGGKGVTRRQCFDCLDALHPNDVQDLDFLQPLKVDDAFLPHIARLTGITHFCPVTARFSGQGWTTLQALTRLEHICTPYGLTDSEMAGIATLQTVNEMEIVATKLTDAGLAAIASMRNLQVLHLEGTPMMTNEGLKAFATLPRLRHLRLSGLFTDKGLAHLAAAPCLKVMWLETPRATEEGLHHLAQIKTLERLCVPWLDQITDRSVAHLQSMPNLKALGVGNAWHSDAGVAALATLANLEVLALKGGPALTDNGLKPLATMRTLRALQIYNSRITEKGLASLAQCRTLDSIEIRSTERIDEQAVARLRAEMPKVQTLDISQLESQARARPLRPAKAMLMR